MFNFNRLMRALRQPLIKALRLDTESQLAALKIKHSKLSRSEGPTWSRMEYKRAAEIREELIALESALEKLRNLSSKNIGSPTDAPHETDPHMPPQLGERLLLLILSKDERINIPGDLEEEYRGIEAKHGARYAKLWYYKQVAASAWPMIRKGIKWSLLASVGEWIRKNI